MLVTIHVQTRTEEETAHVGRALGRLARAGDLIVLVGELGSGKTRLAKGIVSVAASVPEDEVVSPTFTLINRFDADVPVYHADLYRIDGHRWSGIGLEDALDDGGILIVEWGERLPRLHEDPLIVTIRHLESPEERELVLECVAGGSWDERLGNCSR
jgi:tRNA threonylcarbamoyladenosine biosynthesis protein TsaE